MKYEWKKAEKHLYLPKTEPELVDIPEMSFFEISGKGNPNQPDFSNRVGTLYSLAYAIRMSPKQGITPEGYFEYTVYPLEGVWDLDEEGRKNYNGTFDKDRLVYTLMIRQPSFVTAAVAQEAIERTRRKKPNPLLEEVGFATFTEGRCVQMLHLGSYDSEPASFKRMEAFAEQQGCPRKDLTHREIYLSDPGKTAPEKLKTVLRFRI